MLRLNFNIRTTEGTKPVPVYLVARWDGKRLVYPTRQNVSPSAWSSKAQKVRAVLAEPDYASINASLEKLKATAKTAFHQLDNSNNPVTEDKFKKAIDLATGRKKLPFTDFWSFLDFFISEAPKTIDPNTGLKLSPRTIAKYSGTRALLKDFAKHTGLNLSFENLDKNFFSKLRTFMVDVKKHNQNTLGKHFTVLKVFLKAAEEHGVRVNPAFKGKAASATPTESFAIYLNEQDIEKLHQPELEGIFDRVRDLLLLGCYTGLRFSDWGQLNQALITSSSIELFQTKTGGRVVIPMRAQLQAIIDKYGGFPNVMTNQEFNRHVKTVCKQVGITDTVQYTEVKGAQRVVIQQPKYELVSSHTGRRSFATNAYLSGMPVPSIMAITGHRTEKAFLAYLRLTKEEHAQVLQRHFKNMNNGV
ncbi:hypothetical protein A8C56_23575 [Niabella ginsenosidivorans]|uniref:Tyr recombinase domain-containing protein n=1 Tax=Niabella ginsenosidivorans TaxID=1176587 RepID=A0A1A9I890_9BACT|nr:site-specific integrase [Niabella ginsenosidivorans]ANH83555.1 hypothetical protein A8C56_23575 [Niabella ginsenosidivorans]